MHLKRMELAGFKSFAERTVIEFDQGLTAVVGPNGSGKSNITEGIRWVLGEQSAKNLRGGKMPDVIFAGTAKRKPLNIAEVTLVMDNQERFLPIDFSEVSVTRRLKRTGESDFYINKQSCRLKDIVDLFMDSGLGKESFSIISQGKVEAIFNSKPEERRGIFEEAAGVKKYKQRKQQAEVKLGETADNLARLADIIYELEQQLEPLAKQSANAERYKCLQAELTSIDIATCLTELAQTKEKWQSLTDNLTELDGELAQLLKERSHLQAALAEIEAGEQEKNQQFDEYQQQLLKITEQVEQTEAEKNLLAERLQFASTSFKEQQEVVNKLQSKQATLASEEKDYQEQFSKQTEKQASLQVLLKQLTDELAFYSQSSEEIMVNLRAEYLEVMQAQANLNNDWKHLEKEYQQEESRYNQALEKQQFLQVQYQEIHQAQQRKTTQQQQVAQQLSTIEEQLNEQLQQAEQLRTDIREADAQQRKIEQKRHQVDARLKSLQELKANYAGFYQGVRAVLKAKDQLTGIIGAVAELLQVPTELSVALETALGSGGQSIVVENEQDARTAIHFLKEKHLGRATFLPLTATKGRYLPAQILQKAQKNSGFIGVANELIEYDTRIKMVVDKLLGTTLIAQDLLSANQLAKQLNYQYRIVSLEGDVMNPGGSMTGGSLKKGQQNNVFAQQNELNKLNQEAKLSQVQSQQSFQLLAAAQQNLTTVSEKIKQLEAFKQEHQQELQQIATAISVSNAECKQLDREQRVNDFEVSELAEYLTNYTEKRQQIDQRLRENKRQQAQLDEQLNQTDQREADNRSKKEQLQQSLAKVQEELAVVTEKRHHLRDLLKKNTEARQNNQIESQQIQAEINRIENNSVNYDEQKIQLTDRLTRLLQEKKTTQQFVEKAKKVRSDISQTRSECQTKLAVANQAVQKVTDQQNKVSIQKSRLDVLLDNLIEYLSENYQLSFEAAMEKYHPTDDLPSAKKEVKRLKQAISQLGSVNLESIEQYASVAERYDFLTKQREDLVTAQASLQTTMAEMDAVVAQQFSEKFTAIQQAFTQIFPRMFGGGEANLLLTDATDMLTTGIEIVAQPPGKKLQSLTLLSGGERALTALALLFAIIQVSPVPFCVLDEVEAALDEANVVRFGTYLSRFEKDTQFIVITHRKGTMEAADTLYGVTMEEPGISKIVSVRIEDVTETTISG